MKIYKKIGIIYSEYFLDLLSRYDYELECSVETFNNCREQGLIIRIESLDFEDNKGLTFYVYNDRWSDKPSFTYEDKKSFGTLYSQDAWENRTITTDSVEELVKEADKLIIEKFYE